MPPQPVTIRLGPAGSGKTYDALQACADDCWLVAPSEGAVKLLKEESGAAHAFTFRELASLISGLKTKEIATSALRAYFLHEAVRRAIPEGSYFSAAAARPGFAPAVGDLIRELKQARSNPDDLRLAVEECAPEVDDPAFSEKTLAVADIWEAYDALLERHETPDADDLLARAIAKAVKWRGPKRLIVDGFTSFTAQQLELLRLLRGAGVTVEICLTADHERPVLFARTTRVLDELSRRLEPVEIRWESERARHLETGALRHLEENLFGAGVKAACDGSVRVFEAPDPVMEAEMVARAIRRLLEEGTPPEKIAVAQRRLDGAGTLLKSVFSRYQIPVTFNAGEPLGENPLVAVMRAILRLFADDWPRAELLRCARSSYCGLDPAEADVLERRAMAKALHQGRRAWRRLFTKEEAPEIVRWLDRLEYWHLRLERPDSPAVVAKLICQVAGDLGLLSGDPSEEDQAAWKTASSLLWEIARVAGLAGEGPVRFTRFASDVLAAWQSGMFNLEARREGYVQILEAFDARQQAFDALFLMALNERVFPRVVADNPFLRDDEREILARYGVELPRQVELADEERLLLYRAVTAPARQLTLSYARSGADGRETLPSYYLEEARQVFDGDGPPTTARTLTDVVPGPAEAIGPREQVLCAAASLAGHRPLPPEEEAVLLAALSATDPERFADLEAFLRARPDYDLHSPGVHERLERSLMIRTLTVSEIETFRSCPYQHFLSHHLKLREVSEEIGAADIGNLLHAALRGFFQKCRDEEASPLSPEAPEQLDGILNGLLGEHIRDPRRSRTKLAAHAAREYLVNFLQREGPGIEANGLQPVYFELAFGPQPERGGESRDPASMETPLVLSDGEEEVRLSGVIDRVDLTAGGEAAVITDYKLSDASYKRKTGDELGLQMPVYMLAMEKVFGLPAVAAVYQPLRKGNPHWLFRPGMVPELKPGRGEGLAGPRYARVIEWVQQTILDSARRMRSGECAPAPGDPCRLCPFTDVCRYEELEPGGADA